MSDITDAHVLVYLGDSVSTDHISLAGSISKNTPAGQYLTSKGCVTFCGVCLSGLFKKKIFMTAQPLASLFLLFWFKNPTGECGEYCKLSQQGSGQSPDQQHMF